MRDRSGVAVIWISHDLSVVAGIADRVIVMYAGYIVEEAPIDALFEDPRHPYTVGLMGALPSLSGDTETRLVTIGGSPPDLADLPDFCPFHSRCAYAIERCRNENPVLEPVADASDRGHRAACWVDIRGVTVQSKAAVTSS